MKRGERNGTRYELPAVTGLACLFATIACLSSALAEERPPLVVQVTCLAASLRTPHASFEEPCLIHVANRGSTAFTLPVNSGTTWPRSAGTRHATLRPGEMRDFVLVPGRATEYGPPTRFLYVQGYDL